MPLRAFLACLVLVACCGCASLHPRMTIFTERDDAETTSAARSSPRQRTTTSKVGASLTIDLP